MRYQAFVRAAATVLSTALVAGTAFARGVMIHRRRVTTQAEAARRLEPGHGGCRMAAGAVGVGIVEPGMRGQGGISAVTERA